MRSMPAFRWISFGFVALGAALIGSHTAWAWGEDGHRIVAKIAERHLLPEARSALKELLGEESLAECSLWADRVRPTEEYRWSAPLHYINAPREAKAIDLERDSNEGANVVSAIERYSAILADREQDREQRLEALRFLVHFVGDIHQPLHVAYADDRGGNSVRLQFLGERTNLHRVWDSHMIERRMGERTREQYLESLLAEWSKERKAAWAKELAPTHWANESLALVRSKVYKFPKSGKLTKSYHQRNIKTVEERLGAAGVRLAATLNRALVPGAQSVLGAQGTPEPQDGSEPQTEPAGAGPGSEAAEVGSKSSSL